MVRRLNVDPDIKQYIEERLKAFIDAEFGTKPEPIAPERQTNHVVDAEFSAHVMNLEVDDRIEVTDSSGQVYQGTVIDPDFKPYGADCACRALSLRSAYFNYYFQYIKCGVAAHMFGHIPIDMRVLNKVHATAPLDARQLFHVGQEITATSEMIQRLPVGTILRGIAYGAAYSWVVAYVGSGNPPGALETRDWPKMLRNLKRLNRTQTSLSRPVTIRYLP